jgi:hypothetical protein
MRKKVVDRETFRRLARSVANAPTMVELQQREHQFTFDLLGGSTARSSTARGEKHWLDQQRGQR